jgi:hypothetical protein
MTPVAPLNRAGPANDGCASSSLYLRDYPHRRFCYSRPSIGLNQIVGSPSPSNVRSSPQVKQQSPSSCCLKCLPANHAPKGYCATRTPAADTPFCPCASVAQRLGTSDQCLTPPARSNRLREMEDKDVFTNHRLDARPRNRGSTHVIRLGRLERGRHRLALHEEPEGT